MRIGSLDFREVVLADFEFSAPPGERPIPICLVARELQSGRRNQVPVPATKVKQLFGVSRFALYRALDALQSAGLIAVQRRRGRHAIATLNGCLR